MAISDGACYQLLNQASPNVPMSVNGSSGTGGAGLSVFDAPSDNADRFVFELASADHWLIRNVNSGLYLTVPTSDDYAGVQVEQWPETGANAQWKAVAAGSTVIGGVTYELYQLYTWADGTGSTYCMNSGVFSNSMELQNWRGSQVCNVAVPYSDPLRLTACKWAFSPTYPVDPNLPVPTSVTWATAAGADDYADSQFAAPLLYPTWEEPDSWGTATDAGWDWCVQTRTMGVSSSTWGEWTGRTAWQAAQLTGEDNGTRVWLTSGVPATYDASTAKALQVRFFLRCHATDANDTEWIGPETSAILLSGKAPTVTLTNAGYGPSGLMFDVSSDYTAGRTEVTISSIKRNGVELLAIPTGIAFAELESTDFIRIDATYLSDWIDEGDELTITYQTGTDVRRRWNDVDPASTASTATLTVSYETGSGLVIDPDVTIGEGRMMKVDLNGLSNGQAFVRVDGRLYECLPGKDGVATVEYPFNADFDVYVTAYDETNNTWGVWHQAYTPQSQLLKAYPACHAWNWKGGNFLLEVTDGFMTTNRSVQANVTTLSLDARKFETVIFAPGNRATYSAEGILKHGLTESDKDGLEAMAAARHVRYRAPHGDVADVAITGYSYEDHRTYTRVQVDMTQETV